MATIALLENAKIDTVTGLVNRGKLEDTWDRLCKAMQLDPSDRRVQENREVHLLFLDLDGLKYVNDNHGHQAGDEALRKVAGIVKDILSERDVFGRYGGDEMLGILPRRSADEVLNTAITICDTIKKASIAQGLITVSIGLCKADTNQHDLSVACKPADEALYLVKNFGKDGVRRHGDPPGLIWRV
jgi:diguanylate cyclase (GGDEF)-like protein